MNSMNQNHEPPANAVTRSRRSRLVVSGGWALLVLGVLALPFWILLRPTAVVAAQPQRGPLTQEVFGTGTLEAKAVVALSAKITGKVVDVLVDQGDRVISGQVVARLEATDYESSVRVSDAALGQAQAELAKAKLDLLRMHNLRAKEFVSQADLDTAETAHRVAEARVKSAEANMGFARARLADTVIRSTAAGLVLFRNLEVGGTVVPGTPIFRIADTNLLWIAAMVDEREVGALRVGQPARVTFRALPGQSFPGSLARLAREADRVTEEREADVKVDRLPPEWFIGAKADVYIETERKADALQIPRTALVRRGDPSGVLVIQGGRALWRQVQLGLAGQEAVEIVGGLDARDLVIANPASAAKPVVDGQRVVATGDGKRP